jgi:hypothetical protein
MINKFGITFIIKLIFQYLKASERPIGRSCIDSWNYLLGFLAQPYAAAISLDVLNHVAASEGAVAARFGALCHVFITGEFFAGRVAFVTRLGAGVA